MTSGQERRDESVSFSLKELMKLEDERVDQEKRGREAREQSARAEQAAAAEKARAAEAAQLRAAEETRARVAKEEREEEARLEAMQRATIEQTRITVEARTRADEADRERAHERELQRMRIDAQKKPEVGALLASGLGGMALALGAFLFFFFGVAKPASDRRIAELEGTAAAAQDHAVAQEGRLDEQSRRLEAVTKERDAAKLKLASIAEPVAPPQKTPGGTGPRGPTTTTTGKGLPPVNGGPPCDPHDPMCFHLP